MFRPKPERTLFRHIPFGHLLLVVIITALAITGMMVLNLEREKQAIERIIQTREDVNPDLLRLPLLKARADILKMTAIISLLALVGLATVTIHHHYRATTHAFEAAKTLARNILQSIATGVITLDANGKITFVNPSAEQILGVKNVAWHLYTEVFRSQPELAGILRSALEDQTFAQEVELKLNGGRERSTAIRLSTSPLKDVEGQTLGVVLLVRDCSDLARLEHQLRQADKMAALGTLSAGLAHEIKNPLSAIDLNLHLLEEELILDKQQRKEVKAYLDILKLEIRRLNRILEGFMRFAKPSELQLTELDLNAILRQVVALLFPEARGKTIEVKLSLAPSLPRIVGDETQLSQVFVNILLNALQAMPQGGTVEIASHLSPTSPWFVEVLCSDTGVGIPPEHLGRLFDPYFTTREEGMGLGLAIAYRIVKDHGGDIEVRSLPGKGTTLTVTLPAIRHELARGT